MQKIIVLFVLCLILICCFGCSQKKEYIATKNIHLVVDKSSYNIGDDIKILISIKADKDRYLFLNKPSYETFSIFLSKKDLTKKYRFNTPKSSTIKKRIITAKEKFLVEINGKFLKIKDKYYLQLKGFGMINIIPDEYELKVYLKIPKSRISYDSLENIPASNQINITLKR